MKELHGLLKHAAMVGLPGVVVMEKCDLTRDQTHHKVIDVLGGKKADVVMRLEHVQGRDHSWLPTHTHNFLVTWHQMQVGYMNWITIE